MKEAGRGRQHITLVLSAALLLRHLVSLWPYSGAGISPMYGDYEAQRHWMELTINLPLGAWYWYDLPYWGLDYPPLTAYVSWFCGKVSALLDPASMKLDHSRGYEEPGHKVFMRLSVLLLDAAVFFPAVLLLIKRLYPTRRPAGAQGQQLGGLAVPSLILLTLLQPALVLIDHGHFQYNCVCLGLALGAVAAIAQGRELLGSVLFSLSLNFKQMALYYAPAFFFFLLGQCIHHKSWPWGATKQVVKLGAVVVGTFGALWWPFCFSTPEGQGCLSSLKQVLVRQFPFDRGVFEDKVANLWFGLDVLFDLRAKAADPALFARAATLATLCLLAPVGGELLRGGSRPYTPQRLLLAMVNSAMAFFLCSYQVHEKSLLLPLCPLALLWGGCPLLVTWVQVLGAFSMFPLLVRDELAPPYVVCVALYVIAALWVQQSGALLQDGLGTCTFPYGRWITRGLMQVVVAVSSSGMAVLHVLWLCVDPPDHLPHLYPVLFALYSCANLCVVYCLGVYWQWWCTPHPPGSSYRTQTKQD